MLGHDSISYLNTISTIKAGCAVVMVQPPRWFDLPAIDPTSQERKKTIRSPHPPRTRTLGENENGRRHPPIPALPDPIPALVRTVPLVVVEGRANRSSRAAARRRTRPRAARCRRHPRAATAPSPFPPALLVATPSPSPPALREWDTPPRRSALRGGRPRRRSRPWRRRRRRGRPGGARRA